MGRANGRAAGRGQGGGEEVRGEAEEEIVLLYYTGNRIIHLWRMRPGWLMLARPGRWRPGGGTEVTSPGSEPIETAG